MARGIRASLVATSALLGALLVAPSSASAWAITYFDFERAAGMPTTAEPARTLTQGEAQVEQNSGDRLSAEIALGAEPDATTDAALVLSFGTTDPDTESCVIAWTETWSTFEPGDGATRDGNQITVTRELEGDDPAAWDCARAEITGPAEPFQVLDRFDGVSGGGVVGDPFGRADITRVLHRRLPVREWSFVRVKIHYRGADASRLKVRGHSDEGLRVRSVVIERTIESDERLEVRLPVKLRRDQAAKLWVTTRVRGAFLSQSDRQKVRVRPRR